MQAGWRFFLGALPLCQLLKLGTKIRLAQAMTALPFHWNEP
jgi:hypothetical protein